MKDKYGVAFFIIIAIILVSIISYLCVKTLSDDNFCRKNGFEISGVGNFVNSSEDGYLICCNKSYINHIRTDDFCEAIKLEVKK